MENTNECPLDKSWGAICNLHNGLAKDGSLYLCQYQDACSKMWVKVEGSHNISTIITKAIGAKIYLSPSQK